MIFVGTNLISQPRFLFLFRPVARKSRPSVFVEKSAGLAEKDQAAGAPVENILYFQG
jgi:hypothetical protein